MEQSHHINFGGFSRPLMLRPDPMTSSMRAAITTMQAYSLPDIVKADELQIFAAHGCFAFTSYAGRALLLLTDTLYSGQQFVNSCGGREGLVGQGVTHRRGDRHRTMLGPGHKGVATA